MLPLLTLDAVLAVLADSALCHLRLVAACNRAGDVLSFGLALSRSQLLFLTTCIADPSAVRS